MLTNLTLPPAELKPLLSTCQSSGLWDDLELREKKIYRNLTFHHALNSCLNTRMYCIFIALMTIFTFFKHTLFFISQTLVMR